MKRNNKNQKILKILRRMDDLLQRNGHNQYQERIHRISKTLLSIERHSDCFVSKFSIENKNDENVPLEIARFEEPSIIEEDERVETLENDNDEKKYGLDDILSYIEEELMIYNNIESSTLSSSSEDENDNENANVERFMPRENIQKKISKIENKLKKYLQEENAKEIFKFNAFDSILNESKFKTPISKITPSMNTRCIIKNFFQDKECIDAAKKRLSMGVQLKEQLEKLEAVYKCKSNFDKITINETNENKINKQRVSNFEIEENLDTGKSSDVNINSFNFSKRGSIFKDNKINFLSLNEYEQNNMNIEGSLKNVYEDNSDESDCE